MSGTAYNSVNWGLTGTSGVLTLGRFAIRGYKSRRLYSDDYVHLLALLVLITHGVTNQLTGDAKDQLSTATAKGSKVSQDHLLAMYNHVQSLNSVNNCFLYLVFWLVKISFLLFYHQLFKTNPLFKKVWWGVLWFTLLTFWVPIAGVLATCAGAQSIADYHACNSATVARAIKLEYSCVINVISDFTIMALPLWMLKDLKVHLYQKLGLAFIFSLAGVCVALDIVRTVQALNSNQALYTILEINLVVIISCLPTYRALLNIHKDLSRRSSRPSKDISWRSSRPSKNSTWKTLENGSGLKSEDHARRASKDELESASDMEMGGIQVTKGVTISSGPRDPYKLEPLNMPELEPPL